MTTLADLSADPKFQSLSPQAKQIVFDKLAAQDSKFTALSPEAQKEVQKRVFGGNRASSIGEYGFNQYKKGVGDLASTPGNLVDLVTHSHAFKNSSLVPEGAKDTNLGPKIASSANDLLGVKQLGSPLTIHGQESLLGKIVGNVSEMMGASTIPSAGVVGMASKGEKTMALLKEGLNAIVSGEGMTMGQEMTKGTGHQQLGGFAGSLLGPGLVNAGIKGGAMVNSARKKIMGGNYSDMDWVAAQAANTKFGDRARASAAKDVSNRIDKQMAGRGAIDNLNQSDRLGSLIPGLAPNLNLAQQTGSPYLRSQAYHYATKSPLVMEQALSQEKGATQAVDNYFSAKFGSDKNPLSGAIKSYDAKIQNYDKGLKVLDAKERQIALNLARGDQEAFGVQARDIITQRMEIARKKKNDLYDRVDAIAKEKGVKVDVTDIRNAAGSILQDRGRAFQDDPTILGKISREFFAPLNKDRIITTPVGKQIKLRDSATREPTQVSFGEFMSLYRQANSDARNLETTVKAGGAPAIDASQKLHSINQIRDLLQQKMTQIESSGQSDLVQALKEANGFYANQYQNLFRKGVGGEILKLGRFSPFQTENADIFRRLILKGGDPSGVREFMDAAGHSPQAMQLLKNSSLDLFAKEVVKRASDGRMEISQPAVNAFLKKYREPLALIPGSESQMKSIQSVMETLTSNGKNIVQERKALDSSALAKIARSENAEGVISQAIETPSVMKALLSTATPESKQAINRSIADFALKQKDPLDFISQHGDVLKKTLGLSKYQDLRVLAEASAVIDRTNIPRYLAHEGVKDVLSPLGTTVKQAVSYGTSWAQGRQGKAYIISAVGARFMDKLRADEADRLMSLAIYDPEFGKSVTGFLRTGKGEDGLLRRMARYGFESSMSPAFISHMTKATAVGVAPKNEK